jgi:glycosyltransferase involved in cell wall biosynthesis
VAEAVGGVDVAHLHAPWVTANVQVAGIARRLGRPYVLTAHGMLDEWSMGQKRLKKRIYLAVAGNRLLAGAARVHCTAEAELDQARRWMPRANGVVLPLVVDLAEYADPPGAEMARAKFPALGGEGWKLLFLSRVHPKKGVDLLIKAAAELRRRGRACTVLIAGPGVAGYVVSIKRLARVCGVGEAVHFLGMLRGAEKLSLYAAADVFVLPTSQENFGLVLVEAMACGTPVVTTRGVDIWKELAGAGAQIVEAEAGAIASAVERIVGVDGVGERGREWVMEKLDPVRVVGEYVGMYEAVTREGAGSSGKPDR